MNEESLKTPIAVRKCFTKVKVSSILIIKNINDIIYENIISKALIK